MVMTLSESTVTSVSFARFWKGRQELKQVQTAQSAIREGFLELARREGGIAEIRNNVPRSLLESLVQRFEHDNPDA